MESDGGWETERLAVLCCLDESLSDPSFPNKLV